jgi:hypothetical protein
MTEPSRTIVFFVRRASISLHSLSASCLLLALRAGVAFSRAGYTKNEAFLSPLRRDSAIDRASKNRLGDTTLLYGDQEAT